MQKLYATLIGPNRAYAAGASVLVKNHPSGSTATIYSDDGTSTQANPITADSNGYFSFFAANGLYSLTISGSGLQSTTINDVLLYDYTDASPLLGTTLDTTSLAKIDNNLVLPNTAGYGIKLNLSNPDFGWKDLIGDITPKFSGPGAPSRTAYTAAGNVFDFSYANNDVVDINFHIPHDYAQGTDIFIHAHWSHNATSTASGTFAATAYHTYSKGHNQANFSAEKNVTYSVAIADIAAMPTYRHRVDEVQLSTNGGSASLIDTATIEPDGLIKVTFKVTSIPALTGGTAKCFVHQVDLHYQSTQLATKNKTPNFYT